MSGLVNEGLVKAAVTPRCTHPSVSEAKESPSAETHRHTRLDRDGLEHRPAFAA